MKYQLVNDNNINVVLDKYIDLVFSDYVYEDLNFDFITHFWKQLKPGGIFMAMTDHHSIFELGMFMKSLPYSEFVSHLVWKNEWGNHPKDRYHQCFDDIVIFSLGKHTKFYPDRIQVDKVTKNFKLNPSGRQTKTATAFISDICLTTTSAERIKLPDGHLIPWQKPLALMDRLMLPFTDEGDLIVDTHMGSGTLGVWCVDNNRNYVGIENNPDIFSMAESRIRIKYGYSLIHKDIIGN